MYAPVSMRTDNEAVNFFTSDDEDEEEEGKALMLQDFVNTLLFVLQCQVLLTIVVFLV